MKTVYKELENGMLQITCENERWYKDGDKYLPSASWIANYSPKGIGFYKWIASKGFNEAEAIKEAAGIKGTNVHIACEEYEQNKELDLLKYTSEEIECIMSFKKFLEIAKPMNLANEIPVKCHIVDDIYSGGTIDKIYLFEKDFKICRTKFEKGIYIVDLKTSQQIFNSHKVQLNIYGNALFSESFIEKTKCRYDAFEFCKPIIIKCGKKKVTVSKYVDPFKPIHLAILQLGNKRSKTNGFKFTVIEKNQKLVEAAYTFWNEENKNKKIKQFEIPRKIKMDE